MPPEVQVLHPLPALDGVDEIGDGSWRHGRQSARGTDNPPPCFPAGETVGGAEIPADILELWVPAEELELFNRHIVGRIEVVHEFRADPATAG